MAISHNILLCHCRTTFCMRYLQYTASFYGLSATAYSVINYSLMILVEVGVGGGDNYHTCKATQVLQVTTVTTVLFIGCT